MKKIAVSISPIEHRGEKRIKVEMRKSADAIIQIKKVKGRLWSQTKRCWHVPYSKEAFAELKALFDVTVLDEVVQLSNSEIQKRKINSPKKGRHFVAGQVIRVQQSGMLWLRAFVPYDKKGWIEVVRNIPGRKWDVVEKCWELPNVKDSYRILKEYVGMEYLKFEFEIVADIPESFDVPKKKKSPKRLSNFEKLNQVQKDEIIKIEEQLILERLSHSTVKSYKHHLAALFYHYKKQTPQEITNEQVRNYLLHLIKVRNIAESTQNQIINAVKAYWERILKREKEWIEIPRPKKPLQLPNVLSTEEVIALIEVTENLKHKLILLLLYSAGLRRGEVLNLRKRDIHIKRRSIYVRRGKGKKDRYVVLAETVVSYLSKYLKQYSPTYWLFEGSTGGQLSGTSVHNIFTKSKIKSGINPFATVHTLRHSYTTHCLENGFNLKVVQEALGHESIKTTERYLHLTSDALRKVKSPLDFLNLDE